MHSIFKYILIVCEIIVFVAVISFLLWSLFTIIKRIAEERKERKHILNLIGKKTLPTKDSMHKKVAIIAVALAQAMDDEITPHEFPIPPTALISAWQAVKRSELLKRPVRPR